MPLMNWAQDLEQFWETVIYFNHWADVSVHYHNPATENGSETAAFKTDAK